MSSDIINNYLYCSASRFDQQYDCKVHEAKTARMIAKIMNGACQASEGEGLSHAFSHHYETIYGHTGAVEWLRNLPRAGQTALRGLETEAARILETLQFHPYSPKETPLRSRLSTWLRQDPRMENFKESFPHSFQLFEELYYCNNFEFDMTFHTKMKRLPWQFLSRSQRKQYQVGLMAVRVLKVVHSIFAKKWIRRSISALTALVTFPMGLLQYFAIGLTSIVAVQFNSLVAYGALIPMTVTSVALTSLLLGPAIIMTFFVVHVLATSSVFSINQTFGGRSSLVRRVCASLERIGFSVEGCLISGGAVIFPFLSSAYIGLAANSLMKNHLRSKIRRQQTKTQYCILKTTYALHMFSAYQYIIERIEQQEIEKKSLPKEGLEPTPGCPE